MGRTAVEHEAIHRIRPDVVSSCINAAKSSIRGNAGQSEKRIGEGSKSRRYVELAAECVSKDDAVQFAPAIVLLIG